MKTMNNLAPDIIPVNGPSKYSFKLKDLEKAQLKDFPPASIEKARFNKVITLLNQQLNWLNDRTVWSPYPIYSFCEGWAEGDSKLMTGFYFLFPMVDAEYQGQALARVNLQNEIMGTDKQYMAWVDALGEEELDEDNKRELSAALENQRCKESLIKLNIIGKKCSYSNHVLEINNQSDTNVVDIRGGVVVMQKRIGDVFTVPINAIDGIRDNSKCPACGSDQKGYYCEYCDRYWCLSISCSNVETVIKNRSGLLEQVKDFSLCQKCGRKGKIR
jgi:hypothetical protein